MANLYEGEMAAIFDAMYQTFINYDEEFTFYNHFIQYYNCKNVLEIGSGTGNLAKRFFLNNFDYEGLDYSKSMIQIAQKRNPECIFIEGDMRKFNIATPKDSIIITGRSTSYLLTNNDINETLSSVHKNLKVDGIFIFDIIDANRFIPFIKRNKIIYQEAQHNNIKYFRENKWTIAFFENFMLNWSAEYYKIEPKNDKIIKIFEDFSTVRVFTQNEMELFLYLNDFKILEIIDRKTYAYDTYVFIAQKI